MCTSLASVLWSNGMRIASAKSFGKSTELKNFTSRTKNSAIYAMPSADNISLQFFNGLKEYIELFNNITSSFLVIPENHY